MIGSDSVSLVVVVVMQVFVGVLCKMCRFVLHELALSRFCQGSRFTRRPQYASYITQNLKQTKTELEHQEWHLARAASKPTTS